MTLIVREAPSFRELAAEWETLLPRSAVRTPFTHPRWCELWWHHFAENRLLVSDALKLLEVRDGRGILKAVAPFVVTSRPSLPWLRIRSIRLIGADPGVTELSTLVCAPEDEAQVVAALLDYFFARRREWDLLSLGDLRAEGEGARVLGERADLDGSRELFDYVLSLPPDWETFKSSLKRNIKESLRKCYNAPKRDGLTMELRVRSTPAEIGEALERWLQLHKMRSELTDTVTHRNVFAVDPPRAFVRAVVADLATQGLARIFELEIDGRVAASRIGFVLDNALYLYFSGYDPAFRQYSAMTTTVAEAIKWAIENGLDTVNLSPGNDVSKTRWSPTEITFRQTMLPSPSLRGRILYRVVRWINSAPAAAALFSFARRRSHRARADDSADAPARSPAWPGGSPPGLAHEHAAATASRSAAPVRASRNAPAETGDYAGAESVGAGDKK
ncbi:MAG TPA: GNAT family N-acetyltransferase [Burkholderiaceae bacterium]|nr:GNAT family N-acetyltransferase [Burkholderiaceae bacterium]